MRRFKILYAVPGLIVALCAAATWAVDVRETVSEEWRAYIEPLLDDGEELVNLLDQPQDGLLRQELYRFMFSEISAYYIALLHTSPAYPEFRPSNNEAYNFGYPNPDDVYLGAWVEGDGIYRISGYRGTVRIMDLALAGGALHPTGSGELGPTFANYNFDSLSLNENGYFEVVVSQERPEGYAGDWWKLDPAASYFVVRQRMYDLNSEIDGRLAIERLDLPAVRPRATAQEIETQLKALTRTTTGWVRYAIEHINNLRKDDLVNRVRVRTLNQFGGVSYQHYIEGVFDISADEALILETEVPETCRYWNFQLSDFLWRTVGWMHSQSSVNGYTARLDGDGKFRAVIASSDPGVPNWLDTTGYLRGLIYGRWTGCSSQPVPKVTRVKLENVREYLPADTPLISPEQRDAAIRRHREGVQLRHKW
ncbi:MAG: hypothetical protein ACK5HY_10565 [Parahaliea sp.]